MPPSRRRQTPGTEQQHGRGRIRHRFDALEHAPQRRAGADDAALVHGDVDLFPEVVALLLQFLAQPRVLGERAAQPVLRALALRDVLRSDEHYLEAADENLYLPRLRTRSNKNKSKRMQQGNYCLYYSFEI